MILKERNWQVHNKCRVNREANCQEKCPHNQIDRGSHVSRPDTSTESRMRNATKETKIDTYVERDLRTGLISLLGFTQPF